MTTSPTTEASDVDPEARQWPLTFGQKTLWMLHQAFSDELMVERNLGRIWEAPEHTDPEQAVAWLRALAVRHESLRTRFRLTPSGPVQVVDEAGALPVEVVTESAARLDDIGAVRNECCRRPFSVEEEPGWRALIVCDETGAARYVVVSIHHLVADRFGADVLTADFQALRGDEAAGHERLAKPAPQPREIAEAQRSPAWAARNEAALDHWERVAAIVPYEPLVPRAEGRVEAELHAPSTYPALVAAARRLRVTPESLLTALNALAAVRIGERETVLLGMESSNRYHPRWADLVSTMTQGVHLVIDAGDAGESFESFARTLHAASLAAYRHGSYDPLALAERQQGLELPGPRSDFHASCLPTPARGSLAADGVDTYRSIPARYRTGPMVCVRAFTSDAFFLHGIVDPRVVPEDSLREYLEWHKRGIVEVAEDSTVPIGELMGRLRL